MYRSSRARKRGQRALKLILKVFFYIHCLADYKRHLKKKKKQGQSFASTAAQSGDCNGSWILWKQRDRAIQTGTQSECKISPSPAFCLAGGVSTKIFYSIGFNMFKCLHRQLFQYHAWLRKLNKAVDLVQSLVCLKLLILMDLGMLCSAKTGKQTFKDDAQYKGSAFFPYPSWQFRIRIHLIKTCSLWFPADCWSLEDACPAGSPYYTPVSTGKGRFAHLLILVVIIVERDASNFPAFLISARNLLRPSSEYPQNLITFFLTNRRFGDVTAKIEKSAFKISRKRDELASLKIKLFHL